MKCYKKRQQGKTLLAIGLLIEEEYLKKSEQYQKSTKMLQRKILKKHSEEMKNNIDNINTIVLRKIRKCEKIILNTAKGEFPGDY